MAGSYRSLLAVPGAKAFVVPGFVARLPMSMLGLGVVVLVSGLGRSYGIAGAISATLTCAGALGSPVLGGLADRLGQRRVLVPAVVAHCAALAALLVLAVLHAPTWTLFLPAAATGALLPPASSMVRARWTFLLDGQRHRLEQAYAFESVVDELVFMTGPVLVTTLGSAVAPAAGLSCSGALAVIGCLALATQRATEPPVIAHHQDGRASAMSSAGVRVLAGTCLVVGLVFGTMDVSMVAFAKLHGNAAVAGGLLALIAAGSGSSGLWYGRHTWRTSLVRRLLTGCVVLAVVTGLLPVASGIPVMAGFAFVAGLAISPTLIPAFGLVERLVPAGMLTEGFTWVSTALALGVGVGVVLAGQLVDASGPSHALIVCPAAALAAAVVGFAGRRRLSTTSPHPVAQLGRSS